VAVATVLLLLGSFLGFFGIKAFREALFPLGFLFLVTPIPEALLSEIVSFLQWGSAEAAEGLFRLTGLPVLREGYTFHLPKLSVEVAPQCSGIRSSISLFVVSILVGRFWLRTTGGRILLILTVVPITLFKNGVRIVTLALLGAYVDQRILDSDLHRSGGIPIFGLAMIMLFSVAWILRRMEKKSLFGKG
jgi:exosortase